MKTELISLGLLFLGAVASAAPFVNLDFEQASTNSVRPDPFPPYFTGPATDLLPGWQVFRGADPVPTINYRMDLPTGYNQGGGHVTLSDKGFAPERFSLAFCCVDTFQHPEGISIVQRGDVPSDATLFESANLAFSVSVNGQNLNRVPRDAQDFAGVFDISRFAGQNVELRLTTFFAGPFS